MAAQGERIGVRSRKLVGDGGWAGGLPDAGVAAYSGRVSLGIAGT